MKGSCAVVAGNLHSNKIWFLMHVFIWRVSVMLHNLANVPFTLQITLGLGYAIVCALHR